MKRMPIIRLPTPQAYQPRVTHFNERFWRALERGDLTTTRCVKCGEATFPPKPICPRCWASHLEWTSISPVGVIYSYTVVHAAPAIFEAEAPYPVGIIDLEGGLRIALRLLDQPDRLKVGLAGTVATVLYTNGPYFAFKLDE